MGESNLDKKLSQLGFVQVSSRVIELQLLIELGRREIPFIFYQDKHDQDRCAVLYVPRERICEVESLGMPRLHSSDIDVGDLHYRKNHRDGRS